jgi:pimeloyl-ACP methyl ester carboxylesterase
MAETPTLSNPHAAAHLAAGRFFAAGSVRSFVREEGAGENVLLMHGVPASSYLYRKMLPELSKRGLRGVAFDLPGLGLAERPADFDYSWSGLGRWCVEAVDALELDAFHLVIHDLGGPVGLELAAAVKERVRSLTILNAPIAADGFTKPWTMWPFQVPALGALWLGSMTSWLLVRLMYLQGVQDKAESPPDELAAYFELLKREDGGRAFLRIMKGFETTAEKERLYFETIRSLAPHTQLVWGRHDPALLMEDQGEKIRVGAGLDEIIPLEGKHFLQEDNAPELAELVAALAARARG